MSRSKLKSNLFIISGPSGAGEDSIIEGLRKYFPIERVITTTTRSIRPGESEGHSYFFVSSAEFKKGITRRDFAEYAQQYNSHYYGVSKKELERVMNSGKIGIWKIEYKGVIAAKKLFPKIIAIYIDVPDIKLLEERIRRRSGVSDAYVRDRSRYTREWLKYLDIYDYTVVNEEGKLNKAIKKAAKIIRNNTQLK